MFCNIFTKLGSHHYRLILEHFHPWNKYGSGHPPSSQHEAAFCRYKLASSRYSVQTESCDTQLPGFGFFALWDVFAVHHVAAQIGTWLRTLRCFVTFQGVLCRMYVFRRETSFFSPLPRTRPACGVPPGPPGAPSAARPGWQCQLLWGPSECSPATSCRPWGRGPSSGRSQTTPRNDLWPRKAPWGTGSQAGDTWVLVRTRCSRTYPRTRCGGRWPTGSRNPLQHPGDGHAHENTDAMTWTKQVNAPPPAPAWRAPPRPGAPPPRWAGSPAGAVHWAAWRGRAGGGQICSVQVPRMEFPAPCKSRRGMKPETLGFIVRKVDSPFKRSAACTMGPKTQSAELQKMRLWWENTCLLSLFCYFSHHKFWNKLKV